MKIFLIHHANVLPADQDPERRLSPQGHEETDRLGRRFKAAGIDPVRILHSDKPFTKESAQRIAAALGAAGKTAMADYPINTDDPLDPFLTEIADCDGDIIMVGHAVYLVRTASRLVCGDETSRIIEFKPGNCTAFCIEGSGDDWVVAYGWRHEHGAG
jgi:phosphohistidine phosphatase SixA